MLGKPSISAEMREQLVGVARQTGAYQQYLENILRHNKTGLQVELSPGKELPYVNELAFVSAISLRELLGPFGFIDYLEADLQQSEIQVFPPFIEQLTKKVRRIHLGTHGRDTHDALQHLFEGYGWEVIFSYAPETCFKTPLGEFETNDGVLTVRNGNL